MSLQKLSRMSLQKLLLIRMMLDIILEIIKFVH